MPVVDRKEWGMFARGVYQLRWLRVLFLTLLAAMLVSSCGGGVAAKNKFPLKIQPLLPRIPSKQSTSL
jgi:hypothetical protein